MSTGWRRIPVLLALLIALPLALLLAAVLLQLSIDLSAWRDVAAQRASAALGRPVLLQGRFELQLGREFGLHIAALRVQNPAGFAPGDMLTLNEAHARVDLLQALRGHWRLTNVKARDVELRLQRRADGGNNWTLPARARDARDPAAAIGIDSLRLQRLSIEYADLGKASQQRWQLDELSGSAAADQPLHLALRGHADLQTPYRAGLGGGSLQQLLDGGAPWPFKLDVSMAGAGLRAEGSLDSRQATAQFELDATAEQPDELARRFGLALPVTAPLSMRAKVSLGRDAVNLSALQARLGPTEFAGQLSLSLAPGRPRLSGALSTAEFAWPLAEGSAGAAPLQLRALLPPGLALDLELGLGAWVGLPVSVTNAKFTLHSDGQRARLPVTATVAGQPLTGRLDLDLIAAERPRLAVELTASDVALGPLAQQLGLSGGTQGQLGRLELRAGGSGETLQALLPELELSLALTAARLSQPRGAGLAPLAITLDSLTLAARRGGRLQGQASASLLGERARLSLLGGTLAEALREQAMPLKLAAELAPSKLKLQLDGRLARSVAQQDMAINFAAQAPKSGALARWLGLAPASKLALDLSGQLLIGADAVALRQTHFKLGRSELGLDAQISRLDNGPAARAVVSSTLLDLNELATLRPAPDPTAARGAALDAPLLASSARWPDADLALDLQRVLLGGSELLESSLSASIREGRLLPSSLRTRVAGQALTGLIELDPRAEQTTARLELASGRIDAGALLRGLGAADDIDGHVEALRVKLSGRGNSLREFAAQALLQAELNGGALTLLGSAQRPVAEIELKQAVINAAADQAVTLELDGSLNQAPVTLALKTGTLAEFMGLARRGEQLPFWLQAQLADSRLLLEGQLALPLGSTGELTFEFGGDRLDSLSELAGVGLPAWGPWRLRGPIRMTPTGYAMEGLRLRVGESQLGGTGTLDLSGARPRLDVRISGRTVQLDDFPLPRKPAIANAETAPAGTRAQGLRTQASRWAGETERLLSARFLRRLDASVEVVAREVFSGKDRLADGALHLELKDGRLRMDPALLNLPGGAMRLTASFDPTGNELEFAMTAAIERFDYGIIARRLGRTGEVDGYFSLNLDIAGRAPSLSTVMRNANGRFDIAVWPKNLRADVFNLWSVNLVLTLLPLIDPSGPPEINCVIGRFDLRDGRLTEDQLIIDTTRVRVHGSGFADLASEELAFVFRPRAKGLALFRLQTPLRVSGTLDQQRFGINRGDLIRSTLRTIASPILLPIERLRLGPNPRDGADICGAPLRPLGS